MDGEWIVIFILGVLIGIAISVLIFNIPVDIKISQEVGDDICKQLTGNEYAIAEEEKIQVYGGKLICRNLGYDSIQSIVFKKNNE